MCALGGMDRSFNTENTIFVASGDQLGVAKGTRRVSRRRSPPLLFITQRPVPFVNAISDPFGDHDGLCSAMRGVNVTRRLLLPSAFIARMSHVPRAGLPQA